ncbi:MAG: ATP-dependent exonuclease [Eikenella sp.]|nr:ATP-dependent exonuclease [Eikenella sp.]
MQSPHLRRISALCVYAPRGTARSLAYLHGMSVPWGFPAFTFAALLRLELHPHLGVLQRSRPRGLGGR